MDFLLITNDVKRASIAQGAGVDYIMVDLEVNGKEARQGHLNTVISRHRMEDVGRIRAVLNTSRLLVRINPLFPASAAEIDQCISLGADVIMLPMFTHAAEVDRFVGLVGGRAQVWLLLETPQALVRADEIVERPGVDAIHVGLNDLHLGMGLNFMFELVSHGLVDWLETRFRKRGVKFGFGGVARLHGSGSLGAGLVLSEHVRLGSRQVILSRDFQKIFEAPEPEVRAAFKSEVQALRQEIHRLRACGTEELERNHAELQRVVQDLVAAQTQLGN